MNKLIVWLLLATVVGNISLRAQWQQQTIRLNPGWNAVYIDVQPEPSDVDSVFGSFPVGSAWVWNRPGQPVEFVDDPASLVPNKPEWLTYFPTNSPAVKARNLLQISGGRPMIINLEGTKAVDLVLVGRPVSPVYKWVADGYNLVGFPLEDQATHTFETLFKGVPAHAGKPVLKMNNSGQWTRVLDLVAERVLPGSAYWVYSAGPSQFGGTVEATTDQGNRLSFGDTLVETRLQLGNGTGDSRSFKVNVLKSAQAPIGQASVAGDVSFRYRNFSVDPTTSQGLVQWINLTNAIDFVVPPSEGLSIRLEALRSGLIRNPDTSGNLFQSLLSVSDARGYRILLPVSLTAPPPAAVGRLQAAAGGPPDSGAGLWVGNVTLTDVNFTAHPSDPEKLRPAKSEFNFRVLIHLDTNGNATLLQRAMVMWRKTPDSPTSGRLVVATDEDLATRHGFTGMVLRDGRLAVRRLSAPAFAFKSPIVLTAEGEFGKGIFKCSAVTPYNDSLSPFVHRYHVDHDNIDQSTGELWPEGEESYTITRNIEFQFSDTDPLGAGEKNSQYVPGYGDTRLGGQYREVILGAHRRPVRLGGIFTLQRAASVGVLNDGETN